jgi:hypothetical protein
MDNNRTIRLRTTPGESQNIQFKIEQEFDTIDFLSLSITQEDAYRNFCSDYGVVAGRVIANDGFGIENAKISIFIPLLNEDVDNQKITSIYPYSTPADLNSQGIRYNLLPNVGRRFYYYQRIPGTQPPYVYLQDPNYTPLGTFVTDDAWAAVGDDIVTNPTPGYTVWRRIVETNHGPKVPVGTFPGKSQLLDNDILVEVYEKYYKFTTKTNGSGDYMLFGVPVGTKIVHMDVDLSDVGGASLSVDDFLNTGTPPSSFTPNNKFKSSTNLNSLPQIESQDLSVDVIPFWGNLDQCEIGITRQDFNIIRDIVPSATLAFFAFTHNEGYIKPNCGSGSSTFFSDKDLRSIDNMVALNTRIKAIALSSGGEDIDTQIFSDGLVYFTLPMYGARKITNEFGNLVPSPDGLQGIPTEGEYSVYVWGNNFLENIEDGIGTATHNFNDFTFRYDLLNKKRLVYTLSTKFSYNKDVSGGEPTRLIGSVSDNGRLWYPSNQKQGGEKTFGAHFISNDKFVTASAFGNLFFPKYEVKGGDRCSGILGASNVDDPIETAYYYSAFIFAGYFLDITDVFNLLPTTSAWSQYGLGTQNATFSPALFTQVEYDVNITNQTVPLRSTSVTENPNGVPIDFNDQTLRNYVAFPDRLNTDQQPWPKNYYLGVENNIPSGTIFTSTDGETDMGRYYFYFGFTENNNILKVIKERFN